MANIITFLVIISMCMILMSMMLMLTMIAFAVNKFLQEVKYVLFLCSGADIKCTFEFAANKLNG